MAATPRPRATSIAKAPPAASARDLAAADKGVLRFITCGSVDDGKSTLIGRLLYDSKLLFEDQLAALEKDSARHGTQGDNIDFALLLDGLEAEREQGITIDVAYRFFATDKRKFIVADTPGHEQYTRNMATGASTADVAVILIDARKGVLPQTRRHSYIAHLMGVRQIVLAINKMDLVDYSRARFREIVAEYTGLSQALGFAGVTPIPMSALKGENVTRRTEALSWHDGPTLLEFLEQVELSDARDTGPFRLPVQWVNRPHLDFRGFSGAIASGRVRPGDPVVVARSGALSTVRAIVSADGELPEASAGDAVTLVLSDEIDASRGDVFAPPAERPGVSNQFAANLLWMSETPLEIGAPYLLKIGAQLVSASVTSVRHRINVNSLETMAGEALELNGIGLVHITTRQPVAFDRYSEIRDAGAFILIDRLTNQTVAGGMIEENLARATNVHVHKLGTTKTARSLLKGHKPAILWFTGLSGAGKSTVANLVEQRLAQRGVHTYLLDGDNMRHGLNRDLGFTDAERAENIRRVGEVAKLFVDAGLVVAASFISPFRAERDFVRNLVKPNEFFEIFVDAPIDLCAERDPKGLYAKARAGQIRNFTGIDSPYEAPEAPELRLQAAAYTAEQLAQHVMDHLEAAGLLLPPVVESIDFSI
jgi:bifunctional enzyme CysN/CysC